jgi:hypothetical protein
MRLDPRIVAIAKWNDDNLEWHRISDKFFHETGYRKFLMRTRTQLPEDGATFEALSDRPTLFDSPVRSSVATASFCFGWVASGGSRDLVLSEQSVRNGHFGVVTVYSLMPATVMSQSQR